MRAKHASIFLVAAMGQSAWSVTCPANLKCVPPVNRGYIYSSAGGYFQTWAEVVAALKSHVASLNIPFASIPDCTEPAWTLFPFKVPSLTGQATLADANTYQGTGCATVIQTQNPYTYTSLGPIALLRQESLLCPVGAKMQSSQNNGVMDICVESRPNEGENGTCSSASERGNPVDFSSQQKIQRELDYFTPIRGMLIERTYNSLQYNDIMGFGGGFPSSDSRTTFTPFGAMWVGNFDQRARFAHEPFTSDVSVYRNQGRFTSYVYDPSTKTYTSPTSTSTKAQIICDPSPTSCSLVLTDPHMGQELYDKDGHLYKRHDYDGKISVFGIAEKKSKDGSSLSGTRGVSYAWSPHTLHKFNFYYDARGRINAIDTPDGRTIKYAYTGDGVNTNTISSVALIDPDGTNTPISSYAYGEQNYVNSTYAGAPWMLTGKFDESGNRFGTYHYTTIDGIRPIATITQTGSTAGKYQFAYSTYDAEKNPTEVQVTDPNMKVYIYQFGIKGARNQLTKASQPAGSGCAASSNAIAYDGNGNKASEDDFNGHRTCYAYSTASATSVGNLETVRVQGLPKGADCTGPLMAGATLSPTSETLATTDLAGGTTTSTVITQPLKITTAWHPSWALKTRQAEPLKLTTWVYNGQSDPFNGGQTAHCITPSYGASSEPTLPDGSPIAVLCKKVEQATIDDTGALGLSAMQDTSDPEVITRRQWSYTYTQYGQVLTATDPAGRTTTYTYYTDTSFTGSAPNEVGHYPGDLQTVSNAKGLATTYNSYDRVGRLLSMSDANGLTTTYSYTPRGWLKTINVGGLLTQYDYWPTGLLKKATQPDGTYLYYQYDDAHRLTDISDEVDASGKLTGNTVHYTLDNAGNRTGEDLKDASGNLTRTITRTYDALNRLQTAKGVVQ